MEEKKLFLLDAYALIYRAYYALVRSPRVTSTGFNTSAVFGFCNTLEEVLKKEEPGYMAVCFDPAGGHTFRHDAYPDYKAQRDKQPEDITLSIPYIKRILEAYRIPVIEIPGYEADDVIGTLSRRAEAEGFTTYMMTPDKDYGQLVTPKVFMYRPSLRGQGFEIRGPEQVCERYGIDRTSQVIDLLALEGDASDNVPGCPGVGEKTAAKLIKEWGSVENMLDNVSSLKGALKTKIETNAEQIRFSKFLVTIKTDVPLDINPDSLRRTEPDVDALLKIFNELEFKTMAARFMAKQPVAQAPAPALGSLFDDYDAEGVTAEDSPAAELAPSIPTRVVDDPAEVAQLIERACAAAEAGVSVEATGEDAMTAELRGIAVAFGDEAAYIPMPDFEQERADMLTLIAPLFSVPELTLVSHDVKRDMVLMRRVNIMWTARWFDTSVAHYLLSPEMKHDLPTVAFAFLRYKTADYDLTATERKKVRPMSPEEAAVGAGERAALALKLMPLLSSALEKEELMKLYDEIESPFIPVLAGMEWEGVRIDVRELHEMSRKLTARLSELEARAYEMAGTAFNVGSPMQVGEVLFERLQIDPKAKKTKRGAWSTTEEVLEKYARQHPIVELILDIRGLRKLLATYVDALPALINPRTGKIHTTFNQIVTATGRISSTNPNLQNIPIRTEDGREIRRAFIADPGCLILSADYSQIELRLIADISGDPDMVEAFNEGKDIHRATAAKIYHLPIEEVTDDQRRRAKTANFGIIYGISAFGLSERLSIPRAEAKELIENYMKTYPRIQSYMQECIDGAREKGFVTTVKGRKRFLPDINSRNAGLRGWAERNAVNAPLQGSAADIIKIAMIDIDREIRRRGLRSRMIIQVHDELIFNVFPDELAELQALVTDRMEHAYSGNVRLEVSSGVGDNWLEAH
ncbi:MAG: DNA polymerase I [Muribaculaceae bacterium]|nr:DNA polymerase I [Muribaculaceae bacterium]